MFLILRAGPEGGRIIEPYVRRSWLSCTHHLILCILSPTSLSLAFLFVRRRDLKKLFVRTV
jgi:hypothetical protein